MDDEPEMPKGLDADGRREWRRIIRLLRLRDVLDALDQVGLADYLVCWRRLRECEADIATRGVLVDGDRGRVKNPAVQLARTYRDALLKWSREFGFTVASRTRLAMLEARPAVDELEAALATPRKDLASLNSSRT